MSDNDTASYSLSPLAGMLGALVPPRSLGNQAFQQASYQQMLQQYQGSSSSANITWDDLVQPQQRTLAASRPAVEDEKAWLRRRVREVLWTP